MSNCPNCNESFKFKNKIDGLLYRKTDCKECHTQLRVPWLWNFAESAFIFIVLVITYFVDRSLSIIVAVSLLVLDTIIYFIYVPLVIDNRKRISTDSLTQVDYSNENSKE